uniref:Uncharacterized protein n=1 Tax=Cucumis melo TaxID=3656 RepID=A0A9I9E8H0_CUCME
MDNVRSKAILWAKHMRGGDLVEERGIMLFCNGFGGRGLRVVEESMDHGIDRVHLCISLVRLDHTYN